MPSAFSGSWTSSAFRASAACAPSRAGIVSGRTRQPLRPNLAAASWTALQSSPYKELAQTLQVAGARVMAETSSPLGVVTVVETRLTALTVPETPATVT